MPSALILVENASVPTDPRVWPECSTLHAAGWNVTVVCPKGQTADWSARENVDGVEIHRFDAIESQGGAVGYLREYRAALARIRRIVGEIARTRQVDVVQACNPPDILLLAARAARRRGAATIFDHHDLSPELFVAKFGGKGPGHRAMRIAERVGFSLADVVLSANDSFREIALTRGRKRPSDVFVVRNGPDPAVFRPVAPDPDLRRLAPHLIGYVGRMGMQDGVDDAIRALAELRRRRIDWHAVFVGSGEALPGVRSLAASLQVEALVTFTGFVTDRGRIAEILSSCDICLSPEPRNDLNERSTLIKVAEYMAVGRPVVAYDLHETRVTAADSAVYAATDEPAGLADAIDALLDDEPRRRAMGESAARRAATLTWRHSEAALLAAYDRALARKARPA